MAEKTNRKAVLKKALWELLKKHGVNKRINYEKIVPQNHAKGELYHYLKGDWDDAIDKKLCWEIMQEWARKDKILEHIAGPFWQRLK